MRIVGRFAAVSLSVVIGFTLAGPVRAQEVQTGNNSANSNQSGEDQSGDAIGGQVNGVVANGNTSVDAKNTTSDSDVRSGDAFGANESSSFTGLKTQESGGPASNFQTGNNRTTVTQTADATSGDGVSGQIIGAVTEAGGSASIVASNTSSNNDVRSGDAIFSNINDSFVGLNATTSAVNPSDTATAINVQTGSNRLAVDQTASSATGNAIAGEVIGVVSAGRTSVDATNVSTNNDVETVVTESDNSSLAFVGLDAESLAAGEGASTAAASNTQDGNNRATINQFAPGTANSANAFVGLDADPVGNGATAANTQTGTNAFTLDQTAPTSSASVDSIAGQVIGAATAAGGSASFVAANLSDNNTVENVGVAGQVIGGVTAGTTSVDASNKSINNDVVGGVTAGSNDATAFVGLDADAAAVGPRGGDAEATNNQIGSNRFAGTQSASTTSGEPVAGQIIGVVTTAGGSASIVAANVSDDNSVETGDATAPNTLFAFVGLDAESVDGIAIGAYATNTQVKGSNRVTVSETASATSGNGVAGQILGVVSAGATSVDATNDSTFNDVETGDALASNEATPTVGLLSVAQNATSTTVQNGNNRDSADQSAEATSGDAIAGQVGGVVTSAGASASVVLANTSMDIDAETGQAIFDNSDTAFVGLTAFNGLLTITLQ